jgi:hypothetical protein
VPDDAEATVTLTLDEVTQRLAAMQSENTQLHERLARLETKDGESGVTSTGRRPSAPMPGPNGIGGHEQESHVAAQGDTLPVGEGTTSRRRLLQMGAAGAAAVGAAVAGSALVASPAGASGTGTALLIGEVNGTTTNGDITALSGGPFSLATNDPLIALSVLAENGPGFNVLSAGVAVTAVNQSGGAPLELTPFFEASTVPATSKPGQFIVLANGSLWYSAVANKWVQLSKGFTNLLPTPIRVFDSRTSGAANAADPSRAAGPFTAGSTVTLQITGAVVGGHSVPAGASAVIGNVTAVSPAAGGWLTLFPHGEATPLVSNLNFQAGDQARGNFCVVALDATGKMNVFAESMTGVIFDITGYVL